MNNNSKIIISDESELIKLIPEELRDNFSIGFHGFDGGGRYWKRNEEGQYQIDEAKVEATKKSILEEGLKFNPDRKLLSTVKFADLSSYINSRGEYEAGGIIIALPIILMDENGRDLYLGEPNEEQKEAWDRNTTPTSLSEVLLPEEGVLDSRFVLGAYTKNDDGTIEVTLNENHMAFVNEGKITSQEYERIKVKLLEMLGNGEIPSSLYGEVGKTRKKDQEISLTNLGKKSYQHFGSKVAQRLKEIVNSLKNRFLSKDTKTEERDEIK